MVGVMSEDGVTEMYGDELWTEVWFSTTISTDHLTQSSRFDRLDALCSRLLLDRMADRMIAQHRAWM